MFVDIALQGTHTICPMKLFPAPGVLCWKCPLHLLGFPLCKANIDFVQNVYDMTHFYLTMALTEVFFLQGGERNFIFLLNRTKNLMKRIVSS